MTGAAFVIAAICVAAFGGPTWAWLILAVMGGLEWAVEAS